MGGKRYPKGPSVYTVERADRRQRSNDNQEDAATQRRRKRARAPGESSKGQPKPAVTKR